MLFPATRTRNYCFAPDGGFVLVSVLLVVALATVLVVVGSMMAQVERRAAANSAKIEQARGNALFALDVAVGRLQAEAGPDQRISARAEILDATPDNTAVTGVNEPYWTGIWKTGANGLDIVNSGNPQRELSLGSVTPSKLQISENAEWLVSGVDPDIDPRTFTGTTTGDARDAVVMATNYGSSAANVTVPMVEIVHGNAIDDLSGAYAYWVSDEGVKAKVNATAPTLGATTISERQAHVLAPQALHQGKGVLGTENAVDLRGSSNTEALSKVSTLASMQNVPGLAADSLTGNKTARLAADATTLSAGVLSDVRKGGLKKDLTAAFESEGSSPSSNYGKLNPNGTARVYRSPVDTVGSNRSGGLDGLRWITMHEFYNLYKGRFPSVNLFGRTMNPVGANPAGIGNPESALPYEIAPRGTGWTDSEFGSQSTQVSYGMLAPMFLGYRWDVSVSSRPSGTNPSTGVAESSLEIHYYFQIILYNPYTVRLRSPLNNFRYGRALAAANNMYLETRVQNGGATNAYYTALNLGATLQRQIFTTAFDDTASLEPGEIRVFGLSQNLAATTVKEATEFRGTVAPFGLVSRNYAPSFRQTAPLQGISSRVANPSRSPQSDSYQTLPPIPNGSQIRLRITRDPENLGVFGVVLGSPPSANYTLGGTGSADVSIPRTAMWVTAGGTGGSVLAAATGRIGSNGKRIFISGAPGSNSTGAGGSVSRPDFGPVAVETLTETQVLSMFSRRKGLEPSNNPQYTNSSFVLPFFCGNSVQFNPLYDTSARYWNELFIAGNNAWPSYPPPNAEAQLDLTPEGMTTTSWGNRSTGVDPIGQRIVLFDVPSQPLVSLGQFMHMQPLYMFNTGPYTSLGFGSMFVGGSLPSPEVPLTQTAIDSGSSTEVRLAMDHSFLANQALFDSFFFSTVPPAGNAPAGTVWPAAWTRFVAGNNGDRWTSSETPLLNARLRPFYRQGQAPLLSDLRDMDRSGANLLLDGAFNINSTSVEAWVAFLSSLSGNTLTLWNATGKATVTFSAAELQNPFVRFWSASSGSGVNQRWSGIRALSDAQIRTLAGKIVEQIKTRGPFLSMADFLNRRLGSDLALNRTGALQAAIDHTDLNDSVKIGNAVSTLSTGVINALPSHRPILANLRDGSSDSGAVWDASIGIPGYLMQQDLVQSLSPLMTARSDTFSIRVYGEVRNVNNGQVEGRAWGEAVVQRLPDYYNHAADAPEISPPTDALNLAYGRRFQVVSFRWLNDNEI